MTWKPSSVVVCPLQSIVFDKMEEASSIGLTIASLRDCLWEDIECGKYQLLLSNCTK